MSRENLRVRWLGTALAACFAGQAVAGEFQIGLKLGEAHVNVDGDELTSGRSISGDVMNEAFTVSYRWPRGLFAEFGFSVSGLVFADVEEDQHWLSAGWQFDPQGNWKITPRLGLAYSRLTAGDGNIFTSEEDDELKDTVPFVELTVEHKFWRHLGVGLYGRSVFEDWGSSSAFGLVISWTFLPGGN